jgi:hypothetical protein
VIRKPATRAELERAMYRKAGKSRLDLETQILKGCLDWLNTVPGVWCWRQNTGGREWVDFYGKTHYVAFGIPGQADITGVAHGDRVEIEVKRPGEKPTAEQWAWLEFIDRTGGIAFYCDSIETCQTRLREAFERAGWAWNTRWET